MTATKGRITTLQDSTYWVARLIVPPWMKSNYEGNEGTLRQRKAIRRLVQQLQGIPPGEDSSSESGLSVSPKISDREDEAADNTTEKEDTEAEDDTSKGDYPTEEEEEAPAANPQLRD